MRKRIRAAGCLRSHSHLISSTNSHVRISDRQLDEAFRAFTTSRPRYGSNVPGPLEAMRRASKRKNTNMAWSGGGGMPADPAIVMSANPQAGWWTRSEAPTSQAHLPQWFWPFLPSAKPPPPPLEGALELISLASTKVPKNFKQDLKACHDYEALQIVLRREDVNLRQQPNLCEIIMDHVFQSNWTMGEVSKILLEPDLNPPGSSNYVRFLTQYKIEELKKDDLLIIERTLSTAAELGLNDVAQVRVILKKLCRSAQQFETNDFVQRCLSLCISLFRALDMSQVQSRYDLGLEFCERLVFSINKCHFIPAKAKLLWMLRSHSLHNQSYVAVQINVQWLDYLIESNPYAVQDFVDFHLAYSEQLPSVLIGTTEQLVLLANEEKSGRDFDVQGNYNRREYLKQLSSSIRQNKPVQIYEVGDLPATPLKLPIDKHNRARVSTADTNPSAVAPFEPVLHQSPSAKVEDNLRPTRLELWFSLLSRLNATITLEDMQKARSSLWWSYDESMKITRSERTLLYCWTAVALSHGHTDTSEKLKRSEFGPALLTAIRSIPYAFTDDILCRILITLNDLPLPAKDQLLARLKDLTDGVVIAKGRYRHLIKEMQALADGQFAILGKPDAYRRIKVNYPQALNELSEIVNSDLERFENLARQLIRRNVSACLIVQRILMHNQQLKLVLFKAWPRYRDPRRQDLPVGLYRNVSAPYSNQQAVELVHNLATEFALSPVLNSRQALRGVYFCYLYLHHHQSPISSKLTRALWHAAITRRYGSCSMQLVKWLVTLIARLESPEVAQKLLFGSSFQRIRKLKVEELKDDDEYNPIESDQEVSELRNMEIDDSTLK